VGEGSGEKRDGERCEAGQAPVTPSSGHASTCPGASTHMAFRSLPRLMGAKAVAYTTASAGRGGSVECRARSQRCRRLAEPVRAILPPLTGSQHRAATRLVCRQGKGDGAAGSGARLNGCCRCHRRQPLPPGPRPAPPTYSEHAGLLVPGRRLARLALHGCRGARERWDADREFSSGPQMRAGG
jgi:hypothetical protein